MNSIKPISQSTAVLVVIAAALAAYVNTLGHWFVYDDSFQVVENPWIRNFDKVVNSFISDTWRFRSVISSNYYRPMMHVLYVLEYKAFGLNSVGFHLVNVLFHAGASVFVLLVISAVLSSVYRAVPAGESDVTLFALLGALVFALHPMQTESVAWVAAVNGLLAMLLGTASFYLYIVSNPEQRGRYFFSVFLFFAALFSKETAAVVLALIISYDLFVAGKLMPIRYAAYAAAFLVYFGMRLNALGGAAPVAMHGELTSLQCVINAVVLFAGYFSKLVVPIHQNAAYTFHPSFSLLGWKEAVSFVFVIAYVYAFYRARGAWRFAIFWMAVSLMPVLYVRAFGVVVFSERYLYMPAAGLGLLVSLALVYFTERRSAAKYDFGRPFFAAVCAALVFYSVSTIKRNGVWKDDVTLWTSVIEADNQSTMAYYNRGAAYDDMGDKARAEADYKESIRIAPGHVRAVIRLGALYDNTGRIKEAAEKWREAAAMEPRNDLVYHNLYLAYVKMGLLSEAEGALLKGLKFRPDYALLHKDLADVYRRQARFKDSAREDILAHGWNPASAEAHYNMAVLYAKQGRLNDAEHEYGEAIRIDPRHALSLNNRGVILARNGNFDGAIREFKAAVSARPDYSDAHTNLSAVYGIMGRKAEAKAEQEAAARLNAAGKGR